jgi:hypothetical protein
MVCEVCSQGSPGHIECPQNIQQNTNVVMFRWLQASWPKPGCDSRYPIRVPRQTPSTNKHKRSFQIGYHVLGRDSRFGSHYLWAELVLASESAIAARAVSRFQNHVSETHVFLASDSAITTRAVLVDSDAKKTFQHRNLLLWLPTRLFGCQAAVDRRHTLGIAHTT